MRMKIQIIQRWNTASVFVGLLVTFAMPVMAQVNIWTSTVSGKWENPTNWLLHLAPSVSDFVFITNGGSNGKTVTIDATTSGSFSNTMFVTNLSVWGPSAGFTNVLALAGAGTNTPLHVFTTVNLGDGVGVGWLTLSNSALDVGSQVNLSQGLMTLLDSSLTVTNSGFQIQSNGSVIVSGSTFKLNNGTLGLGDNGATDNGGGTGSLVVSNTTLNASVLILGSMNFGAGMLTVQSNSTVNISSNITLVSSSLSITSTMTLNGGTFNAANSVAQIGSAGNGVLTVSGGSNTFYQILLNPRGVGSGGLDLKGGILKVIGNGAGPGQGLESNWVLFDGGDLEAGDTSLTIGENTPNSAVTLGDDSGGRPGLNGVGLVGQVSAMYVGYGPNGLASSGSFTNNGFSLGSPYGDAEFDVTNLMVVGDYTGHVVGLVTMNGGVLCVTNPLHTAQLIISNGTVVVSAPGFVDNYNPQQPLTLGGGALFVDNLIMSNSSGQLINYGQPLVIGKMHLDPTLNADGSADMMNNGEKWANGLDLFNTNWVFAITNVSLANNGQDLQVDWTAQGGHSYQLKGGGSLIPSVKVALTNLGPVMLYTNFGATSFSYTDAGAATNLPRFYRVYLYPTIYPP